MLQYQLRSTRDNASCMNAYACLRELVYQCRKAVLAERNLNNWSKARLCTQHLGATLTASVYVTCLLHVLGLHTSERVHALCMLPMSVCACWYKLSAGSS